MPARHGSVLSPWPRNTPKRIKTITTTAITALIRSSRDQGTRPLFIEKAATSQYSQQPVGGTLPRPLGFVFGRNVHHGGSVTSRQVVYEAECVILA